MSAPSYAREREDFIALMQAEGMPALISRKILRHANTIQRLSAAECNGDYPCDNGERKVEPCSRCEAGYVKASMRREIYMNEGDGGRKYTRLVCPNCRAEDLILQWCDKASYRWEARRKDGTLAHFYDHNPTTTTLRENEAMGLTTTRCYFKPIFQGDPRGACVKLKVPSGKTDDGAREGICVPTRRY